MITRRSLRVRLLLVAIAAAATWAGSRASQGVRTIAVARVVLPRDYKDLARARTTFDSLISDRLHAQGFEVVPPQVGESIFVHVYDSSGGVYDTYTGKIDTVKLRQVHTALLAGLRTSYHADAWLQPIIRTALAEFKGGKVKWDGVEQVSGGSRGFLWVEGSKGTVPALSLSVAVEDMTGRILYSGVGGIQLITRVVQGELVRWPPDSLFNDVARNQGAIHLALDSLPARLAGKSIR